MAAQPEHSKIIANCAKTVLAPAEYKRVGQSRLWFLDHGYWLTYIEFQPSGFSKGSYLNVAAHWLWKFGHIRSFDYFLPGQKRPWISFESAEQFEPLAFEMASLALVSGSELTARFSCIEDIAATLIAHEVQYRERYAPSWPTVHAAIAAGLAGQAETSRRLFHDVVRSQDHHIARYADWAPTALKALDGAVFDSKVRELINSTRETYRLPPWAGPFS